MRNRISPHSRDTQSSIKKINNVKDSLNYLKNAHSVRITKNLVCFIVVTVAYVRGDNEQLERIIFVYIQFATFDFLLNGLYAFLAVTAESQLLFVTPQYWWSRLNDRFRHHVMKKHNLEVKTFVFVYLLIGRWHKCVSFLNKERKTIINFKCIVC